MRQLHNPSPLTPHSYHRSLLIPHSSLLIPHSSSLISHSSPSISPFPTPLSSMPTPHSPLPTSHKSRMRARSEVGSSCSKDMSAARVISSFSPSVP